MAYSAELVGKTTAMIPLPTLSAKRVFSSWVYFTSPSASLCAPHELGFACYEVNIQASSPPTKVKSVYVKTLTSQGLGFENCSSLHRVGSQQHRFMSDSVEDFSSVLHNAKKIVVLSGAGISAESGIPTFRGEGGLWRAFDATELATPGAFAANPSLVWEFYHYRRTIVAGAIPNAGHYAVAALQRRCRLQDKDFILLTQNIDGLHLKAGSTDVVELHGSMWKTRCCHCKAVETNRDMPICAALDGKGAPDIVDEANIPSMQLPRCQKCNGLLRPHVVWFGECLERDVANRANDALQGCDLLLVVGTSAVVYPAAGYAPMVKAYGGVVAEFNTEDTPISYNCRFKFQGPSSVKLPLALGIGDDELKES